MYPVLQVPAGDVIPIMFSTYAGATGASVTLTGLAVTDIEIYKDGSVTQRASDAGYTLLDTDGIDFDGITGIHGFSIDTGDNTDAGFYTVGAWFTVVVSAVTVDSQTVNFIAAMFRIVPAESSAGVPKTDVSHFGGTAGTFASGRPEVNTTLIEGSDATNQIRDAVVDDATRIDASALNTLSSHDPGEAIMGATDLGTGSGLTSLATATELAKVPKSDGTATWNATALASIQSEANDALVAYDPPTNAELVSEINAVQADIAALNNLSAAQVNAEVDAAIETYHLDHLLAATYDPASKPGAADALLNELVESDGGVARFTANALEQGPSGSGPSAADIADAVWEEALGDHSATSGSTAEALAAAGGAGDPWITPLPGSYSAGQAGYIVGTNLNATVSSRASQSSLDDVPTNAELATALDPLPTAAENATAVWGAGTRSLTVLDEDSTTLDLDATIRAAVGLGSANLDTQIGDLPTNSELSTALGSADDAVLAAIAALNNLSSAQAQTAAAAALTAYDPPTRAELTSDTNSVLSAIGDVPTNAELATALDPLPTAAENAAAVLAATVEGSVTVVQSIRLANAALGGKASGLETTEATYRDLGDTKDRIVATVDSDGNRTAVTRDLT